MKIPRITNEQIQYFSEQLASDKLALEIIRALIKIEAEGKEASKTSLMKEFSASRPKLEETLAKLEGMTLLDINVKGMLYMIKLNENGQEVAKTLVDMEVIKFS